MYEHNALGYWSGLALCLTKVRSSRARCPATALILQFLVYFSPFNIVFNYWPTRRTISHHEIIMKYHPEILYAKYHFVCRVGRHLRIKKCVEKW